MSSVNRMSRTISKLNVFPRPIRRRLVSLIMGRMVPYVGTSNLVIEEMTEETVVTFIPNRKKTQNHIRNVHAAAMALLAETCTGFVVAMNLPDNRVPLIKSFTVHFKKRTQGDMRAVATLTEEQRQRIKTEERGNLPVEVHVTDESGDEPIQCEMIWAWVPKK